MPGSATRTPTDQEVSATALSASSRPQRQALGRAIPQLPIRPAGPARGLGERLADLDARAGERRRPHLLGEALIVAWLGWLYDLLTGAAPIREHLAIANARGIWQAERWLGIDPELALNRWLSHHYQLSQIASYYYDNAHFIVTIGLLVWLYVRRPDLYRPLRSSLALVNLIAFAVFWLYPLAPPRMLSTAGFYDIVGHSNTFGQWHTGSLAASADQFAAMPSVHVAWAVWSGMAIWQLSGGSRRGRLLAFLYPMLTTLVIFATGNHFLFDALGGLAAMACAWALVRIAPRLLAGVNVAAATSSTARAPARPAHAQEGDCRHAQERALS